MAKIEKDKRKRLDTYRHEEAKRRNIPTAEYETLMEEEDKKPRNLFYPRNPDLDPQLVWTGKDKEDEEDLKVTSAPIYIQEKIHPYALVEALKKHTRARGGVTYGTPDLFGDFNGLPDPTAKTEFYKHDQRWSNRMILGDSLQIMTSLADREGLRGKVQCIYMDPPYGIKFNSNFQLKTNSNTVGDKKRDLTTEPEQYKAFRDTWELGVNSYLSYLRDRMVVARDLLKDSGSIFLQIGDENVHLVRSVMDEVFGRENFINQISYSTTSGFDSRFLSSSTNYVLWYGKDSENTKYRKLLKDKDLQGEGGKHYKSVRLDNGEIISLNKAQKLGIYEGGEVCFSGDLTSQGASGKPYSFMFHGEETKLKGNSHWKTHKDGMFRLIKADRISKKKGRNPGYIRFFSDFPKIEFTNMWTDTLGQNQFGGKKIYVVQTALSVIKRCLLMTTDPDDLILDPTCGSGTTAYVAEQWGRRWITTDTSRVALALARGRLMGANFPYYLLADSKEGQDKEAQITRNIPPQKEARDYSQNLKFGFVYERVPHITLKSIAHNSEIDVIYDDFQEKMEPIRHELNNLLNQTWEEWELPRHSSDQLNINCTSQAKHLLNEWWELRIQRQQKIDASIKAKADFEVLYDKPYIDKNRVRVSGPFTVESLSPHRMMAVDEKGDYFDPSPDVSTESDTSAGDFTKLIIERLRTSGVKQQDKRDRINFDYIEPWSGNGYLSAIGAYREGADENGEGGQEHRVGIFIGDEYRTVSYSDLLEAAKECRQADVDILIACGFAFDPQATDTDKIARVRVLRAVMNNDLHMDLKDTDTSNLFVIFGEPDIDVRETENDEITVKINGVSTFNPQSGQVNAKGTDDVALWMIDTNYDGESFFVRQVYFLGDGDPYQSLKRSLNAEIDKEAWQSLNKEVSRPFTKPSTGRIAVKVINTYGDEVMKVIKVS